MRVDLQPAYVLHTRPFQDSSLLVTIFSLDYGRLTLLAKGVRNNKSHKRQLLQPFIPLNLSWQGKSSLKTLVGIDADKAVTALHNKHLYCGFYINELLMYLLPENDSADSIFQLYEHSLSQLMHENDLEQCLRYFEFSLLADLGYGIDFVHDNQSGTAIMPEQHYYLEPELGFILADNEQSKPYFLGAELLAIANHDYTRMAVRRTAKQVARFLLDFYLQGKEIKSRDLFRS
ncbi:MAG: DNA repair protein RecO [Pseudomonadota bacterium]